MQGVEPEAGVGAAPSHIRSHVVWVCIAVFNRVDHTRRCLNLLRRQTYTDHQTVIVDDGSTDGTSEMVVREYPEAVLIRGDGSLYWTRAMHQGIAYILMHAAQDDYTLLLNDDLMFEPDLIQRLFEISRLHTRSLIQAVESCIDNPDVIWAGGVKLNLWTAKQHLVNFHRRISEFPPDHIEHSDYLTGRGVLVPMEVFRNAGNFNTGYKQSGDPEFSRRAAKKGYRLLVTYGVRALSYEKGKNINETESYSLSDVRRYYFGVLSHSRISTRWKLAVHMTDSGLQALLYFAFDFARITWHFLSRLSLRVGRA
jgi:GT2 family glycosyltransferase